MSVIELLTLLKQYGPLLCITIYLVWQGWVREMRLTKRIEDLESEQKDVLLPLVERCADVIGQNTKMMERLERRLG